MRRAAGEGGRVDDVRLCVEDVASGVDHALVAVGAVDDGGDVAAVVDEVVLVKEEVEVPLGNDTCNVTVQGDTSGCGEPPVDIITKVPFWPGHNLMCHPVHKYWSFGDTACIIVRLQTELSDTGLCVA